MPFTYRNYDFLREDVKPLFDLYAKTWQTRALEDRWDWEYVRHPSVENIKLLVAEDKSRIVAATTRVPFDLLVQSKPIRSYFSINSMADPDYRGQGLMSHLYQSAASSMPLLFSKGSSTGMYKLLMKIGYRPIDGNTFLVKLLKPVSWLLWRFKVIPVKRQKSITDFELPPEFATIARFNDDFDDFFHHISDQYAGIVVKTASYMNWRYIDIPHRTYLPYYRIVDNQIVSMLVLKESCTSCRIMDIIWDRSRLDEPQNTIKFAANFAKKAGFIKLICWVTDAGLRQILKEMKFIDRNEVIPFSFKCQYDDLASWFDDNSLYFAEGDGDSEYIQAL